MSDRIEHYWNGYHAAFNGLPRDPPVRQPSLNRYLLGYDLGLTERLRYDARQRARGVASAAVVAGGWAGDVDEAVMASATTTTEQET